MKRLSMFFALLLAMTAAAGEVSGRKMAWAHYVPWFKPENASLTTEFLYDYPLQDVAESGNRTTYYQDEFAKAKQVGIDGFFIDIGASRERGPSYDWDLRQFLNAAEGTDFQIGICLDHKMDVPYQVGELKRMLKTYGDHPNYPKWNGRYVIATYTFPGWTPEEWREIRKQLKAAGYDIFLIANLDPGVLKSLDEKTLDAYADCLDAAYMFGAPGINNEPPEVNNRILDKFARKHGKLFLPCLHPGYYGAWLKSTNDFYQPFLGLDMLYETFASARESHPQWVHLTTWNDLIETALMPRAFTPGIVRTLRAYLATLKETGVKAKEPEVVLAYHREELPGTLLRIEALNLPSEGKDPVVVSGLLRDIGGKPVAGLASKTFAPGEYGRAEWLIPTANLVRSPYVVPEITVQSGAWKKTVSAPAVFFVSSWLQNATTVNIGVNDLIAFDNALEIAQAGNRLSAAITFRSPELLKRAILFKNDRPVALFTPGLKSDETLLSVKVSRVDGSLNLKVNNGRILRAVKNYEKNGCPWFRWNASSLETTNTPKGAVIAVTAAGGPDMTFTVTGPHAPPAEFKAADICAAGELGNANGTFFVLPEMTVLNAEPLKWKDGELKLNWFARTPRAADSYFVRYETMDGKVAFSKVQYPFANGNPTAMRPILETPVSLETPSGPTGWCRRDKSEFLTPDAQLPVKKTRVVEKPLSLLTERAGLWKFDGNGDDAIGFYSMNIPQNRFVPGGHDGRGSTLSFTGNEKIPMRFRYWPCGTGTIGFWLNPAPYRGKAQSVIFKSGWTDGVSVNLLADGRVEALRTYHEKNDRDVIHGKTPLVPGKWTKIEITTDGRKMRLFIDGKPDGQTDLAPVRTFGNCTVFLGGGMAGYENYAGLLDELSVKGL